VRRLQRDVAELVHEVEVLGARILLADQADDGLAEVHRRRVEPRDGDVAGGLGAVLDDEDRGERAARHPLRPGRRVRRGDDEERRGGGEVATIPHDPAIVAVDALRPSVAYVTAAPAPAQWARKSVTTCADTLIVKDRPCCSRSSAAFRPVWSSTVSSTGCIARPSRSPSASPCATSRRTTKAATTR